MTTPGRLRGITYGPPVATLSYFNGSGGPQSNFIRTLNHCFAFRFRATRAVIITGFRIRWNASNDGTGLVTFRLETIDPTTGKPTGTLVDPNATVEVSPGTGATGDDYTFSPAPTTELVAGTPYALVAICTQTNSGGALVLHYNAFSSPTNMQPNAVFYAADGSTRSNLAVIGHSQPLVVFTLSDGTRETFGLMPWFASVSQTVHGLNQVGGLLEIPAGLQLDVTALEIAGQKVGTPAGDLILKVLDAANTARLSMRIDRGTLDQWIARRMYCSLDQPLRLRAGRYRVVLTGPDCLNGSNCYGMEGATAPTADVLPSGMTWTASSDGGATWTETDTRLPGVGLVLDDLLADPNPRTRPLRTPRI